MTETCTKMEFTKILLLSETHQRPIGDPSETDMTDPRPRQALSETDMPDRRPRHNSSETNMPDQRPQHATLKTKMPDWRPIQDLDMLHRRPRCLI